MKTNPNKLWFRAGLVGLLLAGAVGSGNAQTIITNSYTNNFPIGANTSDFVGSGSVASWIYWYNTPGTGNITNDITMNADGNASLGSLSVYSPFQGVSGTQNVFFGTFGNQYGYDFSVEAHPINFSNIQCKVHVPPGTPLSGNGDFGNLGIGFINSGYGYSQVANPAIPASATNGWVTLQANFDPTAAYYSQTMAGICFGYNNYGGYPTFNMLFNIADVALVGTTAPLPPPPTLVNNLQTAIPGLNIIGTSKNGYQRYQVATVADSGYSFVGQPSVTYSYTLTAYPTNTDWQQHLFLVNGPLGQYDTAADYNRAQCIFLTLSSGGPGTPCTFNFRYKTNEPGANLMLFNTLSPTNAANTNLWPAMPVCSLVDPNGPLGTWSFTFSNTTNFTVHTPSGLSTNYVLDAATAALFADPLQICLGGQDNSVQYFGEYSVISQFSVTGNGSPFTDNFATDAVLNTNYWMNFSNDTNGCVLVPTSAAYWLAWSIPDLGFSLEAKANLQTHGGWQDLSSAGTILNNGKRQALVAKSMLPSANSGYFNLVSRSFSQLLVLLPGETNAPGTLTGKVGSPTPANTTSAETVTVVAVDASFYPVQGITDSITLSTSDGSAFLPVAASMVNGTVVFDSSNPLIFQTGGGASQTVTATDNTSTNIPPATSSPVIVN